MRAYGDAPVAGDEIVVDILHLLGDNRPAVGLRHLPGFLAEAAAERLVRQQKIQALGERLRTAPGGIR